MQAGRYYYVCRRTKQNGRPSVRVFFIVVCFWFFLFFFFFFFIHQHGWELFGPTNDGRVIREKIRRGWECRYAEPIERLSQIKSAFLIASVSPIRQQSAESWRPCSSGTKLPSCSKGRRKMHEKTT